MAESFGTAWLLIAIVGSGIMAERLSPADAGLQLLQNVLVTGFALAAIIAALRPVSGAHVNPAVTLTAAAVGQLPWREAASYLPAQIAGGIAGTLLANLMFGLPLAEISGTVRDAPITWLGDLVATVGLLSLIFTLVATRSYGFLPGAVGAYVAGAYYFTSSTGVANPAVSIGRIFTDTFFRHRPPIRRHLHPRPTNRRRVNCSRLAPSGSFSPFVVVSSLFGSSRVFVSKFRGCTRMW